MLLSKNPPTLKGVPRAQPHGPCREGAQEGNEAASLHPLDLSARGLCHVVPRSANCGRLMPPGAAFCPVFGGAFTVRFVTFSVVMGDGTTTQSSTRSIQSGSLLNREHAIKSGLTPPPTKCRGHSCAT